MILNLDYPTLKAMLKATPAFSVGFCIFSVLFYVILLIPTQNNDALLVLFPNALLKLDLNAFSFYIFRHANFIHLLVNLVALFPMISRFEKDNGTVHTGVTINLLAVATALLYCIVGLIISIFVHKRMPGVIGLSGIFFSFLTYYCHKARLQTPALVFKVAHWEVSVPTMFFPWISLLIVTVIVPFSSFLGHLVAIVIGYLFALDCLRKLYPPSKVILFIESKLAPGINKLKLLVDFVSEEDAATARSLASGLSAADLESAQPAAPAPAPATFEPFSRRVDS